MASSNASSSGLTALDLYYLGSTSTVYLYGYLILLSVGFVGNAFQIATFSRKTMRHISTGVMFLALSISDTIYLCLCPYLLVVYGFKLPDQSDYARTCQFRHFLTYLTTNFSAWMLVASECAPLCEKTEPECNLIVSVALDRWIRSQFPVKAQQICQPRTAIYVILIALLLDCALHVHLLTPMFGQSAPGVTTSCNANDAYPTYVYFYSRIWPVMTTFSVTIVPASCMVFSLVGIAVSIKTRRNRILPASQRTATHVEKHRARYLHRQMLILMFVTLALFFFTTLPAALYRFVTSTLGVQQPFAFKVFLSAILAILTTSNYTLNFYLHSLTSTLFRKEFVKCLLSARAVFTRENYRNSDASLLQQSRTQPRPGHSTQLAARLSHTYGAEMDCDTNV